MSRTKQNARLLADAIDAHSATLFAARDTYHAARDTYHAALATYHAACRAAYLEADATCITKEQTT